MNTARRLMIGALFLALAAAPWSAEAGTDFTRRVSASPDGVVEVENLHGSIIVTGWAKNEVEVSGALGDWVEELEIRADDDQVEIEVVPYDDWHSDHNETTDLHLKVPRGSELWVEGVNVTIEVSGVDGHMELETVNGAITVNGSPASVDAETVNGTIEISGSIPRVQAEVVSGTIRLEDLNGDADAQCVSGQIEILGGTLTSGSCSTVSGDVVFDAGIAGRDSFDFETHSGSIILILSADVSAEFDIETFSGDIMNEMGPQARRTDRYTPGKELYFSVGKGRTRISAETFSGTVEIRKRK